MSKVPQHLIDEATRRGIVPGALVEAQGGARDSRRRIVGPYECWRLSYTGNEISVDAPGETFGQYILCRHDQWAKVVSPAPSVGLQEGDACEASPAMRAAIIELAKELGVPMTGDAEHRNYEGIGVSWVRDTVHRWNFDGRNMKRCTPEAFIAKMRATAKKPKPIRIGDYTVKFNKGGIEVGCTKVDNETVRAIAEKLQD